MTRWNPRTDTRENSSTAAAIERAEIHLQLLCCRPTDRPNGRTADQKNKRMGVQQFHGAKFRGFLLLSRNVEKNLTLLRERDQVRELKPLSRASECCRVCLILLLGRRRNDFRRRPLNLLADDGANKLIERPANADSLIKAEQLQLGSIKFIAFVRCRCRCGCHAGRTP